MADNHFESGGEERVWDEYDWERFLQQQDRKTEKYMELLEKYIDDPNRDQIIAREMGWHHLLDENGKDWGANLDTLFSQRQGESVHESDEDDEETRKRISDDEDFEDEDEDEEDADGNRRGRGTGRPLQPPSALPGRQRLGSACGRSFSTTTRPPPSTRPSRG